MFKQIGKSSLPFILASSLMFFAGCDDIENSDGNIVNTGTSQFVSAEVIDDINASTMLAIINAYTDFNTTNPFGFESAFGYKAVKIVYKTIDITGNSVNASGLLVIPTVMDKYEESLNSIGKSFSISMICDNHGTIFTNAEAPTNEEVKNGMPDYPLAVSMTGYAGFAGIFPDYVGYGSSNSSDHPYLIKNDSAKASLDMIKASMRYMENEGVKINYQLYISGYSQGGHVAMALAEEVESSFTDSVNLMGVAPMAGPYIVSAFGDAVLKSDANMSVPAFMAYVADSYSNAYNDVALEGLIVESKVATFDGLFSGENNATVIHQKLILPLGAPTLELFDADFISSYESTPAHPLRVRFGENNVGNWAAKSKINLIHCRNDDVVPSTMSDGVKYMLDLNGAVSVEQYMIDGVSNGAPYYSVHGNCGTMAYGVAVKWFADIRSGVIE